MKFWLKLKALVPTKRKLMQLYFALLFNANLKGFSSGNIYKGSTKQFCVPGINCYSCPGAVGACPLGSLQGSFSADKSTIFYVCGILLLYGLLFGRMICGWLCPFGLVQELLYKIKTPKLKKGPITRILSAFKYAVLVFFVGIVPIMYAFRDTPLPAFCKYICPAGTLEGGIGLLANEVNESYFSMLGPLFTWKFVLFISIAVASVFVFRMFCRFICPLGALYGFFNKISFFGVKVEKPKCINCNLCVNRCKMDIKQVGDRECISCGECINVCPTKAIVWKGPSILHLNPVPNTQAQQPEHKTAKTVTRAVSAVLMLAVLIGSFVYYWNSEPESTNPPEQSQTEQVERGNTVGKLCYASELSVVDGNGVTEAVIDPSATEKITVINFWGTWCTPCVNELPYFDRIASEYEETVSVIAVHTEMAGETEAEYLKTHYPESKITFAVDLKNEAYYSMLGGRGTYPYTVVLDEKGIVRNVFLDALEYDDLKQAVENASKPLE
ncbi:MAG: 4Fe-4S binding protein [Clostridia bacterium]|nr:4Fe-4S binding protein [Clostridia bacterium]